MRFVLASASPRRAELLRAAGYTFDVSVADVDERALPGEAPKEYVRRLASAKAARVQLSAAPDAVVLGADTVVVVDGDMLGKPRDDRESAAMVRRLSGREHDVITGVCLRRGGREVARVDVTLVQFAPLTDEDVAWYVASGEGRDKAGAYAIQGLASRFVSRIDGSYTNVVGLPINVIRELVFELERSR